MKMYKLQRRCKAVCRTACARGPLSLRCRTRCYVLGYSIAGGALADALASKGGCGLAPLPAKKRQDAYYLVSCGTSGALVPWTYRRLWSGCREHSGREMARTKRTKRRGGVGAAVGAAAGSSSTARAAPGRLSDRTVVLKAVRAFFGHLGKLKATEVCIMNTGMLVQLTFTKDQAVAVGRSELTISSASSPSAPLSLCCCMGSSSVSPVSS